MPIFFLTLVRALAITTGLDGQVLPDGKLIVEKGSLFAELWMPVWFGQLDEGVLLFAFTLTGLLLLLGHGLVSNWAEFVPP